MHTTCDKLNNTHTILYPVIETSPVNVCVEVMAMSDHYKGFKTLTLSFCAYLIIGW